VEEGVLFGQDKNRRDRIFLGHDNTMSCNNWSYSNSECVWVWVGEIERITLHFVPFHFVPGYFVPVTLSPESRLLVPY
jgi:hypothetical protein